MSARRAVTMEILILCFRYRKRCVKFLKIFKFWLKFWKRRRYFEDNYFECLLTSRHNCDVRKDSYQSNHTILKISWQLCDLIGDYCFWHHSYDAEWECITKDNLWYFRNDKKYSPDIVLGWKYYGRITTSLFQNFRKKP